MQYLGHLSKTDPLYGYLCSDILPQLNTHASRPTSGCIGFRPPTTSTSTRIYPRQTRMIGKFFGGVSDRPPETAFRHMEREFNNLSHLRSIGLAGYPHYVARPLGRNASLDCVLVEEFCYGTPLDDFILGAIREGAREKPLREAHRARLFSRHPAQQDRHRRAGGRQPGLLLLRPDHGSAEKLGTHRLERGGGVSPDEGTVAGEGLYVGGQPGPRPRRCNAHQYPLRRRPLGDRDRPGADETGRQGLRSWAGWRPRSSIFSCSTPATNGWRNPSSGTSSGSTPATSRTGRAPFGPSPAAFRFTWGCTLLRIARNSWITDAYRRQLLDEARETLR